MRPPLSQAEDFEFETLQLPVTIGDALPYLTYTLFDCLHLNFNYELCAEGAEWDGLEEYVMHVDYLPPSFCSLLKNVENVIGIMHPRIAAPRVIKQDEDALSVPAPQSTKPLVTFGFRMRSAVYTKLPWSDIYSSVANKRPETFYTASEREKEGMHVSEC